MRETNMPQRQPQRPREVLSTQPEELKPPAGQSTIVGKPWDGKEEAKIGTQIEIGPSGSPIPAVIIGLATYGEPRKQYQVAWWEGKKRHVEWLEACEVRASNSQVHQIGFGAGAGAEGSLSSREVDDLLAACTLAKSLLMEVAKETGRHPSVGNVAFIEAAIANADRALAVTGPPQDA
jgi:hypothetical protein